jgi:hypothetical protein
MTLRTRLRSTTWLHRVAIHESAHGVVAIVNRLRFKKLTIVPGGGAAGHLEWDNRTLNKIWYSLDDIGGRSLSSTVGTVERRIMVSLAELVAERKFAPEQMSWRQSDASDRPIADTWLQHLIGGQPSIEIERGPPAIFDDTDEVVDDSWDWASPSQFRRLDRKELKALRAKYRRRAAVLVDRHWSDIRNVARELLEQKTLSYAQTCKLVNSKRSK